MLERAKIKEDFDKVITYSQNIPNPQTSKLFERWFNKKTEFIRSFGGECIFEYPEKVSFELDPKEKHDRVMSFIAHIENEYDYYDLSSFIESQEEGFFNNLTVKDYTTNSGKLIKKGSKLVRSFKYFVSNERSLTDIQNEASRIIQEDKIEGILCLSVHPLDFLSLSENTHNWRSCHALDGEYRAGNLSYMIDSSTMVAYLKSDDNVKLPHFPEDVPWNSKKWRVLLYLSEDRRMIFAGRPYPFAAAAGTDFILKKALPAIGLCEESIDVHWSDWNNLLVKEAALTNNITISFDDSYVPVGRELVELEKLVVDGKGSCQFNDVISSSCYSPIYAMKYHSGWWSGSYLLTRPEETKFIIGGETPCLWCGEENALVGADTMMCEHCELEHGSSDNEAFCYCDCCGSRMFADDARWVCDEYVCPSCYENNCRECEVCGDTVFNQYIKYDEKSEKYMCDHCYEDVMEIRNRHKGEY